MTAPLPPYTPADLTPLPGTLPDAARVARAYGRLHCGPGARWAEVLFGVTGVDGGGQTEPARPAREVE